MLEVFIQLAWTHVLSPCSDATFNTSHANKHTVPIPSDLTHPKRAQHEQRCETDRQHGGAAQCDGPQPGFLTKIYKGSGVLQGVS